MPRAFVSQTDFRNLDQELTDELALVLWGKIDEVLQTPPDQRHQLLKLASADDGGQGALKEVFDVSLNDLFQSFLGRLP